MRACTKHWIELRDKFESSNKLIATQIISQQILLDSTVLAAKYKDPYIMQEAVGKEGCPLCFFEKELNQNPIAAIETKFEKMPKIQLDQLIQLDKDLVEKNKQERGQP